MLFKFLLVFTAGMLMILGIGVIEFLYEHSYRFSKAYDAFMNLIDRVCGWIERF